MKRYIKFGCDTIITREQEEMMCAIYEYISNQIGWMTTVNIRIAMNSVAKSYVNNAVELSKVKGYSHMRIFDGVTIIIFKTAKHVALKE